MGLPGFLVAATGILAAGSGGGGGGEAEAAPAEEEKITYDVADSDEYYRLLKNKGKAAADEYLKGFEAADPGEDSINYDSWKYANDYNTQIGRVGDYADRVSKIDDFDTWLGKQGKDVKNASYGDQHAAYKKYHFGQVKFDNPGDFSLITNMMGDDYKAKTAWDNYNPGLFTADEGVYGDVAGMYRTKEAADNALSGYLAEQDKKIGDEYRGYITDLGYGNLIGDNMTSDQLKNLWGEVQKRDEYKGILDDLGFSYDPTDDSTSLGYLVDQGKALVDVRGKLKNAEDNASKYYDDWTTATGDMADLQKKFDELFEDYGTVGADKDAIQAEFDALMLDYGDAETRLKNATDALGLLEKDYDALTGVYNTLDENYGTLTEDYNKALKDYEALTGQYGDLEGDFDALTGQYGDLKSDYDKVFGDYSKLTGDYDALSGDYDKLYGDYGLLEGEYSALEDQYGITSEQLAESLAEAGDLRKQKQIAGASSFLQETEADRKKRMEAGVGGIGSVSTPAMSEYTNAMEGLAGTQLNPNAYSIKPIDYAGSFDQSIFNPTPTTGMMGPDAYGTTDYTDIFAGPEMDLSQYNYDFSQNFNPYFDAINQQYGVDLSGAYQLPPLGGRK